MPEPGWMKHKPGIKKEFEEGGKSSKKRKIKKTQKKR
jgi:hypothetical protein